MPEWKLVDETPCVTCGHPYEAHQHYRAGFNCGLCRCRVFLGLRPASKLKPIDRKLFEP